MLSLIVKDIKEASIIKEEKLQDKERIAEELAEKEKQAEENGMGNLLVLDLSPEMKDEKIFEIIHSMSHQKIIADDKWIHIPLVKETVDQLYYFLQRDDLSLSDHYRYYFLNTITKWENKDFSNAVDDHNTVWSKLGGNVGEAYDLMNQEEEKEYIINAFGHDFLAYLIETNQWEE